MCTFFATHGKAPICRVPEKMAHCKILAHGKLLQVSDSELVPRRRWDRGGLKKQNGNGRV
jgi:hypothetical protein